MQAIDKSNIICTCVSRLSKASIAQNVKPLALKTCVGMNIMEMAFHFQCYSAIPSRIKTQMISSLWGEPF